jgi:hypothetical protein
VGVREGMEGSGLLGGRELREDVESAVKTRTGCSGDLGLAAPSGVSRRAAGARDAGPGDTCGPGDADADAGVRAPAHSAGMSASACPSACRNGSTSSPPP